MTAYEMRISDWSADVCSSDLAPSSGCIDELQGLAAGWILEGRAAGARPERLARLALGGDPVPLRADHGRIAGRALEQRLHHHCAFGQYGMAIAVGEPFERPALNSAIARHQRAFDQYVRRIAANKIGRAHV